MEEFIYKLAIYLPGFLFAIVCHEWAHAYVALRFGDDTAKNQGRLTLNPVAHMDIMGTVIWPLFCLMMGGIIFGYAKPVPVNTSRFKKYRQGLFWVSFAGPLMNIALGIVFSIALGLVNAKLDPAFAYYRPLNEMLFGGVIINFILAVFNLIPFPPLDGSKMVTSFLDYEAARKYEELQRFSLIFLLILWFTNIAHFIFAPAQVASMYLPQLFRSMFI